MKKVLVTGSDGFIGRNLMATLAIRTDIEVQGLDVRNSWEEFESEIRNADFIFHLAGVNRPKDPAEFASGNAGLTEALVDVLIAANRKTAVLISSSIQAATDNIYGRSKLGAEYAIRRYGKLTGACVFPFRLPNVFGKWCRTNYNSVVATWCHNTARGLPIQINDPNATLTLIYVDDVIQAFIGAMDGESELDAEGFCRIPKTYDRTLRELANALESFVQSRTSLIMPKLGSDFELRLYATWLSYLPENDFSYPLDMKRDDRGWLAEFIKSQEFGQIFVSRTKPGITRGNHWHHTKVEKFLVICGKALVRFRKIADGEILEYPVEGDILRVVDIPPGFTHSITNIGEDDLVTIFWADEIFNPEAPDTYFLEV